MADEGNENALRARAIEIPKYYGDVFNDKATGRMGVIAWTSFLDDCQTEMQWDAATTATRARMLLMDEAAQWLQNERQAGNADLNTWNTMKDAMIERFLITSTTAELAELQLTLKQGHFDKDESVSRFYDRCREAEEIFKRNRLVNYPAAVAQADRNRYDRMFATNNVHRTFVTGLRKEIRSLVNMANAPDMPALLRAARMAEATWREEHNKGLFHGDKRPQAASVDGAGASTSSSSTTTTPPSTTSPPPPAGTQAAPLPLSQQEEERAVNLIGKAFKKFTFNNYRGGRGRGRGRGRGQNRGRGGGNNGGGGGNAGGGQVKCYRCGGKGHMSPSCPTPREGQTSSVDAPGYPCWWESGN